MLYLIATPIGNLQDISFRAIETLKKCDYILCEDTRHSKILFQAYDIHTPCKSFHQFNEKKIEDEVIQDLKQGRSIGVISDAGTPGICDPGESLVKRCYAEDLPLRAVPGPSAWVTALSLSPFPKHPVQFLGFLPKRNRKNILTTALMYLGTTIFYETPQRLISTLKQIPPQRTLCIMRELTKIYEEHRLGAAHELLLHYEKKPPRGECVLLIGPSEFDYSDLSVQEHVQYLTTTFELPLQDALKLVAEIRGVPKREVYHAIHRE